jgi:hypothetical protein
MAILNPIEIALMSVIVGVLKNMEHLEQWNSTVFFWNNGTLLEHFWNTSIN